MPHVALLGDSIFDNGVYVPGGPPFVDQLCAVLPEGWSVSLLAVDGHVTANVEAQLAYLPEDATHIAPSTTAFPISNPGLTRPCQCSTR